MKLTKPNRGEIRRLKKFAFIPTRVKQMNGKDYSYITVWLENYTQVSVWHELDSYDSPGEWSIRELFAL